MKVTVAPGSGFCFGVKRALKIACDKGLRLASDSSRTNASEGFWTKQERKGRATCVERGEGAEKLLPTMRVAGEMWPCKRYALKTSCPASRSLAAARPRRRRRR